MDITIDTQANKRAVWAWTMYDWANSSFATTIMAAVLPVYYSQVAASTLPAYVATAYWGYTTSIALLITAILSPILGAVADFQGAKKRYLTAFMAIGVTGTALLYFVRTGDWIMASLFFIIGNIGFSGSLVFYNSLLPHVSTPDNIDQVSSRGYAMGYIGGGLLLAINLGMILLAPAPLTGLLTRLTFVTVAIWWLVFSIPILRYVREPRRRIQAGEEGLSPIRASLGRLGRTFRDLRRYRDLFLFLVAFWVYNNGIGTIIIMATIYGAEIGIGRNTLIGTLLMVQFLAAPFAFAFGWLAKKIGARNSIYLALAIYTLISVAGYFLKYEWQFWALGAMVATVQGGSQALSRSLLGRMMPASKSAEFFGFFSVSEKFAGIAGPALFGFVSLLAGGSRLSIISLIVFFVAGALLLSRVNVERGIAQARIDESEMTVAG